MIPNVLGADLDGVYTDLSYSENATIYAQADPADYWYVVCEGVVQTSRLQANGRRQITGFFFPGEVFGLDPLSYKASAQVVGSTAVVRRCQLWTLNDPDAWTVSPTQRALDSAESLVRLLGRRGATERVAAFLLMMQARTPSSDGLVRLPMTRSDIADHLGLTMETISRTFSDLGQRGLIRLAGTHAVQILDRRRLEIEAGGPNEDPVPLASRPSPPTVVGAYAH